MIVYNATKQQFIEDSYTNSIEDIIVGKFNDIAHKQVNKSEINSWKNSLVHMERVLNNSDIPDNTGICIEYHIPRTNNRIDFIVTGQNEDKVDHALLIELKQWSSAELTDQDSIVRTMMNSRMIETTHPSYQAWSYASLMNGFNSTIYNENIQLKPCAYLHNYKTDDIITNSFYNEYIEKAPIFLKNDLLKLQNFIKGYIKHGDTSNIISRIDQGKIKPSKSLSDSLKGMLKGNLEFVMIDNQKVVYEAAIALTQKSSPTNKNVLIVKGGPGTGKSVVSINLLAKLNSKGLDSMYVTRNSAPRTVYASKLTGTFKKTEVSNFFCGSGSFTNTKSNEYHALIVDEAHRLNKKSGMFKNLGENQIKEIINACQCSIFFLDEDQKVTFDDIGDIEEIKKWAHLAGASVHTKILDSQFRCNGSDGYIAWLDNSLQIRETANKTLDDSEYEFKVLESPVELRDLIFEKNKENNKSRLVAGYCWDWQSKTNSLKNDINFPEYNFHMKWNLSKDGMLWILSPESVNEIGCIHTCQGLEVDYIGVIIGPDLIVRNGKVITDASKRSKNDRSVQGYKTKLKENKEKTLKTADSIIKNTYRTLMTRGMKGCYIYSVDAETNEYFTSFAS